MFETNPKKNPAARRPRLEGKMFNSIRVKGGSRDGRKSHTGAAAQKAAKEGRIYVK